MKLSKTVNRKVGDVEYAKFIITIPKRLVTELGWSEKTELNMRTEPKSEPKRLVIEKI